MGMSGSSNSPKSRMALSEINVTPLVDVMLVLLIIFMVTAPLMQQGLEVELPETADSGVSTQEEPAVLVLRKDKQLVLGDTVIPYKALGEKLKAIYSTKNRKQIYIQADKNLEYGFVADIMSEVRAAGIYNIGLITVPKPRQ
jgi:biopolymer transport protein TolR